MAYYLKHWGIVGTPYRSFDSGISGSAAFQSVDPLFGTELHKKKPKGVVEVTRTEPGSRETLPSRVYGVNAKKFKDKVYAYCGLRKSSVFLAFYSISFPVSVPDDIAYKAFNSLLTNLRQSLGLKSYIWVMERQGNGTVHYHLLTHDYMYIRDVNSAAAGVIDYYVSRGHASWGKSSRLKYNGVDVRAIVKKGTSRNPLSRRQIIDRTSRYLSKYMSKDLKCDSHRVWHCSRSVSALFVTCYMSVDEFEFFFQTERRVLERLRIVRSGFNDFYFLAAVESAYWQETVGRLNEMVWDYFESNRLW